MAFGTPPMDTIFLPYGIPAQRNVQVLARAVDDPRSLVEPIRSIVRDLDPDQAMPDAYPWNTSLAVFIDATLLGLDTLGAMGGLGLLLALVGLYGLIAYDVSARTREFGIRLALGARAGALVRMVLRQGVVLAASGVGIGLALTWAVLEVSNALLPGSGSGSAAPPDPNGGSQISLQVGTDSFGGAAFTVLVIAVLSVTILAAYVPARRAARVDPTTSLRAE
jgi:ABC-type antimicrobial peptide transport system permease subunit